MRFIFEALLTFFLSWAATTSAIEPQFVENPGSAYPPSCITAPLRELDLTTANVALFYSDRIWLEVVHMIESDDPFANLGEVQLDLYRYGCAEPNRSVVIAEFSLPTESVDPRKSRLFLPWLGGNTGFDPYLLAFKPEAGSGDRIIGQTHFSKIAIGDFTGGWDDARRFSWRFVLDVPSPGGLGGRGDAPWYYNGRFVPIFHWSDGKHFLAFEVPATQELLEPAARLPLSGRLSGNWVEDGSADQGILISIGTPIPPPGASPEPPEPERSNLLISFSWFTYDAEGQQLWLTGAAQFGQGDSAVLVPLENVTHGAFLANASAERATVGSARLTAISCDRIRIDYRLDALGLGNGLMEVHRLQAMEIADFPCRDFAALQSSIYPPGSN